jgi:hypothetical protein
MSQGRISGPVSAGLRTLPNRLIALAATAG